MMDGFIIATNMHKVYGTLETIAERINYLEDKEEGLPMLNKLLSDIDKKVKTQGDALAKLNEQYANVIKDIATGDDSLMKNVIDLVNSQKSLIDASNKQIEEVKSVVPNAPETPPIEAIVPKQTEMKIRFYILTCLLFGGLVSCNDWLDVKPETEMTLEEMYADQQGFQDALTGAYLELKNSSAYGTELMYGTIEYLAQHWDYTAESIQEKISQFNYIDDNVQNRFTLIYTQLYKIILSVNAILEQIDAKQDVFEPGMYEIIKGECLAMRAYCHFDLLRLFGPMPTRTTASKILPYVTKVGIEYNTHHSYQEFTELLENDLTDAGKLLYPFDPVIPAGEDREELNLSLSAENFLTARQIRFNYYAVKAMEARFYLWLGGDDNKAKAYDCATEVIEAQDSEGKTVFTLGSTDNIAKEDYSFSTEHILAIYDYNLKDNADNTFTTETSYSKARNVLSPDLFPSGTTDIRFISLWKEYTAGNGSVANSTVKFIQKEGSEINQLPLIRLVEMYFIAMECGTLSEANRLYEEFCLSRDIELVTLQDEARLEETLIKEYNKEFYAEGQAFYAFKRLAVEDILWAEFPGNEESYVVPLPLTEINYGN